MGHWLVDLDGTLVQWDGVWRGPEHIAAPIPAMVDRVKRWLADGRDVRIFTARVYPIGIDRKQVALNMDDAEYAKRMQEAYQARAAIHNWSLAEFGRALPVQCWKDYQTVEIWDDRAVSVIPNTGRRRCSYYVNEAKVQRDAA